MDLCKRCITPLEEGMVPYLPDDSLPFHPDEGLCNACHSLEKDPNYGSYSGENSVFKQELKRFLDGSKKIVFAYSGGLDSTVTLDKLNTECASRGIELKCFTINHGFKGSRALDNIRNVIKFDGP